MVQFGTSNSNMAMHAFVCLSKIQVGTSNTNLAMQAFIWFSMVQSVTSNSNFRPLQTLKMPNQKEVPQLAKYGIITNSKCCFYLNNDKLELPHEKWDLKALLCALALTYHLNFFSRPVFKYQSLTNISPWKNTSFCTQCTNLCNHLKHGDYGEVCKLWHQWKLSVYQSIQHLTGCWGLWLQVQQQ